MKMIATTLLSLLALSAPAYAGGYTEKFENQFRNEFKSKYGIELGPNRLFKQKSFLKFTYFDPTSGMCYEVRSDSSHSTRWRADDSECVYLKGSNDLKDLIPFEKRENLPIPSAPLAYLMVMKDDGIAYCAVRWNEWGEYPLTYEATVHPSYCKERLK